jgi:SepF-like predicted cell division protein (DUF552 family)
VTLETNEEAGVILNIGGSSGGGVQSAQTFSSPPNSILLKALPLKSSAELERIKADVKDNTIVILKITPLAQRNLEELKTTIEKLTEFSTSFGGDIARLGEERIVITPPGVRIWRGEGSSSSDSERNRVK